MSLSSAKAKLDAQGGDPVTGYISKTDHQESYDELVDDTALTGTTTAEALDVTGALTAGTIASDATVAGTGLAGGLLSSANPIINGVAAPGTSAIPSRQDHVHPSDTTKVTGPASATDNAVARFDGTTGKLVQNSGVIVDDSNNIIGVGTIGSGAITSSASVQAAAGSGFVSGASGPKLGLSGTGSPEGVVTAPVGSTWIDTAATTGAIKWVKASGTGNTGWVVEYGDTGLRNLSAETLSNGWTTVSLWIQRVGQLVYISGYISGAAASNDTFYTFPTGFRPQKNHVVAQAVGTGTTDQRTLEIGTNGASTFYTRSTGNHQVATSFVTAQAWPSSLPGSAA